MPLERLFLDISAIVVVATLLGLLARWLKQPLILGYVLAGIILGPSLFGFISEPQVIGVLSSFGIAFLLFLVGLELDLSKLKVIGRPSLLLGFGQVLFTAVVGFGIIRFFGFDSLPAIYIAIALTFSSTIIVVKLLSERQALESLYGRLAIGMLLMQDFIAIFALIILSGFAGGQVPTTAELAFILLKGAGLIMLALLSGRFILPHLFMKLARSSELLLLSSIAWCFGFALVAVVGGFSLEIGAFLAGLALARLPYHLEIVGRVRSLRDFFITIFFVLLGSQLLFANLTAMAWPFIILSLFVLVGNPLIVMVIMGLMGYTKRTGFLVGLTVAQISEFSLILMHLGYRLGHVNTSEVALVTLIGITTITLSSYLITYGDMSDPEIYDRAQLKTAKIVISTVPDINSNQLLLQETKRRGLSVPIYVTADTWQDTENLYSAGADYVVFPHYLSGEYMSTLLKQLNSNPAATAQERERHLKDLHHHYKSRHKA